MKVIKQKFGFTIVESLISLLLMAIVLMGGMAFYFYSSEYAHLAYHKEMAMQVANARMEELKNTDYRFLASSNSLVNITDGIQGQEVVVISNQTNYKRVTLALTWQEPDKQTQEALNLETYITR